MRVLLFVLLIFSSSIYATDSLNVETPLTDEEYEVLWQVFKDSVESSLTYDTGQVSIKNGLAIINVPPGYKFLNAEDSDKIITDIWGNPPSEGDDKSLGMILPAAVSPLSDSSYAINITYTQDGFVKDDDAAKIDYDDLLETMQEDTKSSNPIRIEQGYPAIELVGWASPPYYDSENKKLHWAKELKFGGTSTNTLNYNIRILGRKGYLQLNAIGEMSVLDQVLEGIEPILNSVDFTEGNQYKDFDPKLDKIAAYGIGGLIAGKVLAKAGILAKIGIVLAKFWKVIAIGFVAFFAGFKRLFGKKESDQV